MSNENYGVIIGFGIAGFFGFLFTRMFKEDLGLNQDQLNMLGVFGGFGLIIMIYGFYMLIKTNPVLEDKRDKISKEYKLKQINDNIISKYDSMPDISSHSTTDGSRK